MMKVALLSHRGGNIGHEFMSLGMQVALQAAFGSDLQIDHFEQHKHFSVYPKHHWLNIIDTLPHGQFRTVRQLLSTPGFMARSWPKTLPLEYNLALACGGPNIVTNAYCAPELKLMLHHLNGAFHYRGVPLIDAGVGSCFPLTDVPDRLLQSENRLFYAKALEYVTITSVRDTVAEKLIRDLGTTPELIPCAAICTGRIFEKSRLALDSSDKYVAINFQRVGSNSDWGQNVDPASWMSTMQEVIRALEKRHKVLILCHNAHEYKLAGLLAPHIIRFQPRTADEYASVINRVKVGLVSRIHAAIPLAGLGIPSLVVGNDTRLGAIDILGLPTCYVKSTSSKWLIDQLESLLSSIDSHRHRLLNVRETTLQKYSNLFRVHSRS